MTTLFVLLTSAPAAGQERGQAPDGNALVQTWRDAATRGDAPTQAEALRRLEALGFWTPPVVALARWTLAAVPQNAVLLAQTDGDAVPLAMLQTVEALRPDVRVVSVSVVGDSAAAEIAASWRTAPRPVVGALTLDPDVLGRHAPSIVMAGAYQRPGTATEPPFDLAAAEASAGDVRGADFVGPRTSPTDTDPERLASPVDVGGIVLFTLLQTAVSHAQAGDGPAAEHAYARAGTFATEAQIADDPLVGIAREWIDEALVGTSSQP